MDVTREIGIVCFGVAAVACVVAGVASGKRRSAGNCWHDGACFWITTALGFGLLSFDLALQGGLAIQSLIREFADANGWYENRRPIQVGVLIVFVTGGGACLSWAAWVTRRWARAPRLALLGLGLAVAIWFLELLSLHGLHGWIFMDLGPIVAVAWGWLCAALLTVAGAVGATSHGARKMFSSRR